MRPCVAVLGRITHAQGDDLWTTFDARGCGAPPGVRASLVARRAASIVGSVDGWPLATVGTREQRGRRSPVVIRPRVRGRGRRGAPPSRESHAVVGRRRRPPRGALAPARATAARLVGSPEGAHGMVARTPGGCPRAGRGRASHVARPSRSTARRLGAPRVPPPTSGGRGRSTVATWLILPVVICLSQRLSHACLSISAPYTVKLRMAH